MKLNPLNCSFLLITALIAGGLVAVASGQDGRRTFAPAGGHGPSSEATQGPAAPDETPRSVWSDYDRDGYPDLYIMGTEAADRLLHNGGDGFFRDVTAELGLSGQFATAQVLWQDHDADLYPDLVLLSKVGALRLYRNERGFAFLDVSELVGLEDVPGASTVQWIDYDLDGESDLMLQTTQGDAVFFHTRPDGSFERITLPGPAVASGFSPSESNNLGRAVPSASPGEDRPRAAGSSSARPAGDAMAPPSPGGRSAAVAPTLPPYAATPQSGRLCFNSIADTSSPGDCLQASSVPTVGMLFPLTDDFMVDPEGNLGVTGNVDVAGGMVVGIDANLSATLAGPPPRLYSKASLPDEDAILGAVLVTGGLGKGVVGKSSANMGEGVHGEALSLTGPTRGVCGLTKSDMGEGVRGEATAASGATRGVVGTSESDAGEGVRGEASATTGTTRGVCGVSDSDAGEGVHGEASATTGATRGVCGVTQSPDGIGVEGVAVGGAMGVLGQGSMGVRGEGSDVGVEGEGQIGIHGIPSNPLTDMAGLFEGKVLITDILAIDPGPSTGPAILELIRNGVDWDLRNEDTTTVEFTINRNGSTKLAIEPSGNVGIGTSDPNFLLEVNGSAGKPGGGPWSNASDARLKKKIHDLDGALETLLALRGVTFEYKDPEAIHELPGQRIGFIAQEVEKVLPDWVDEGRNGYKRLTARGFEALAVEGLREIVADAAKKDARIAELEARNTALEQRITRLEGLETELASLNSALQAVLETR